MGNFHISLTCEHRKQYSTFQLHDNSLRSFQSFPANFKKLNGKYWSKINLLRPKNCLLPENIFFLLPELLPGFKLLTGNNVLCFSAYVLDLIVILINL